MEKTLSEALIAKEEELEQQNHRQDAVEEYRKERHTICQILKQLCLYSLPIMPGLCFYSAYILIDTALLGRYFEDESQLVSFGLAMSAMGILIESVGIGFTSGVETLVAWSFGAN